jgi:hypothetical protein
MGVVESRVALEAGSVSACSGCSGPLELGGSRNSPGGRWNAVFTGPLTMPAWKPAFASPKEIVEPMILQ